MCKITLNGNPALMFCRPDGDDGRVCQLFGCLAPRRSFAVTIFYLQILLVVQDLKFIGIIDCMLWQNEMCQIACASC